MPFLIFIVILPESPRWLFANNKEQQGIKICNKMARINGVTIKKKTWDDAKTEKKLVNIYLKFFGNLWARCFQKISCRCTS